MYRSRYAVLCCFLLLTVAGCQQQMANQPSDGPLAPDSFFPNDQSARPLEPDTVSRDQPVSNDPLYTGKVNGQDVTKMPFPVTDAVLARGQQRYNIYCALCHDKVGNGNGIVVQRGYTQPPSFHTDRLRAALVGHFFDVISNGYGQMPSFAKRVPAQDRWDIIAYIRALQLSQDANLQDIPANVQIQLQGQPQ